MSRFPHPELQTESRLQQGMDTHCAGTGARLEKKVAPVPLLVRACTEAAHWIEKDGTGIGAGYDMGCLSALGIRSVPAQDVNSGHGRPRTPNAPTAKAGAATVATLH